MASLRVAMLAPFGIRPKGTLSARMLPLAQALVRRGHRVSIIAPPVQNPQDAGRQDTYAGVLVQHTALPTWRGPAHVVQQVMLLLHTALATQPDILHLFKPKGYSGLAALLACFARPTLPLVVDTDDWEGWGGWNDLLPYPRAAKTLFAWQERDLPARADAVTVVSRTLQDQVEAFGVAPERVFFLPNGIAGSWQDLDRVMNVQHAVAPTLVLYTRFWEFDLHDFLQALVAIVNQHPMVRLRVIGRGERGEEQELLRLAERAGILHTIDYRGWVEPHAIPALLASSDIALAPMDDTLINRARGLAKLLELMEVGLPIVAGHVGQAAEYIEQGRSGILVPPRDPAAMVRAVLQLLDDASLCTQLGQAARARAVAHYTWDILASTAERAYTITL